MHLNTPSPLDVSSKNRYYTSLPGIATLPSRPTTSSPVTRYELPRKRINTPPLHQGRRGLTVIIHAEPVPRDFDSIELRSGREHVIVLVVLAFRIRAEHGTKVVVWDEFLVLQASERSKRVSAREEKERRGRRQKDTGNSRKARTFMIKFLHFSLPLALFISASSNLLSAAGVASSGKVSQKSRKSASSSLVSFSFEGGRAWRSFVYA